MKRSTDRILTTHVGSLVRPDSILDIVRDRPTGASFNEAESATIAAVVKDAVRKQVEECGIDIPTDGEFSKSSFSSYVSDRLTGWEMKPGPGRMARGRDRARFREAYADLDRPLPNGNRGGGRGPNTEHLVCTGPITYRSEEFVRADIANLKAALEGLNYAEAFMPAVGPGTVELQRDNEYYKTSEEYVFAIAEALKTEYKLIVDAGFVLQIDDPRIVTEYDSMDPAPTAEEYRKFAQVRIEALNYALKGLPEDRIRYHLCWGSWHGPHSTDAPLEEIAETILQVNAGAFSIEGANPRHEHEYHVWERIKFPEGKVLIPGTVAHTTNHIEHPELIAERITRYANLVGRENVIASIDCGFAQGAQTVRAHPSIMWAKFQTLAEGAALASKRLWS